MKNQLLTLLILTPLLIISVPPQPVHAWGASVHSEIAKQAIDLLPSPWKEYFINHANDIGDASNGPDRRKSQDPAESGRHYDDEDSPHQDRYVPYPSTNWSLGVVAWAAENATRDLITALEANDTIQIIRYMGDTAHYISDATQPLHATKNYDGQLTGNNGIHSRFETQVVQRNFDDAFNLTITDKLTVVNDTYEMVEAQIKSGLALVPEILSADDNATAGSSTTDEYYTIFYNETRTLLRDRLSLAIYHTASIWYTALVKAGWIDLTTPSITTNTTTPIESTSSTLTTSSETTSRMTQITSNTSSTSKTLIVPTLISFSVLALPLFKRKFRK